MPDSHVLLLACPDRPGIVATVSTHLFEQGYNILDAQQFDDAVSGDFFMRVVFDRARDSAAADPAITFKPIADEFQMTWSITSRAIRRKVMIWVSKFDHCLADLIYRWRIGEMAMDLTGIVSNHPRESYAHLEFGDVPFFHCPVSKATKLEQEQQLWQLVKDTGTELVVLARYMQVLSDGLAAKLSGKCINIHHSFLPGFKGAKPYHQAHGRGVKLIGATAHFVTADLDEGPIIEQDVRRVTHAVTPDEMVEIGREIEASVLSRAVRWYAEHRIFQNGSKTVIL